MGMRIGVDFDGTICKWASFPNVGEPVPMALHTIKQLIDKGHEVYIWTVRSRGFGLEEAVVFCISHGLMVSGFNKNPDQLVYSSSPKIDCDLYIDDKALGCPLMKDSNTGRDFVNWEKVRYELLFKEIL